jgi:N-acetylmuramoyl-L-alanine amidase
MRIILGLIVLPFVLLASGHAATSKSKSDSARKPATSAKRKSASGKGTSTKTGSKTKTAAKETPTPAPESKPAETTESAETTKSDSPADAAESTKSTPPAESADKPADNATSKESEKPASAEATPPPPPTSPKSTHAPEVTSSAPKSTSGPQRQGEWILYRLDGRDYVTMENIADFYGLGATQRISDKGYTCGVGQRRFRCEINSKEFYINDLKFILSYPILEHLGQPCVSRMDLTKLIEPVMRPSRIKGAEIVKTVVLDAGHGGHDNGAWSPYGYEKQFTLDVVYRTKKLLEVQGYRVVLTRSSDTFIPLYDRSRIANRYDNAVFVSVHFNSGGAGTGLETYTLAPRGVPSMMADGPSVNDLVQSAGNINDAQNMALATATHAAQVVRTKLYDRGIKRARFVVLRETTIPAVLLEGGFLSNSYDAKIIAMPEYRQQMAASIVTAVNNYRRAVGGTSPAVAQQPGTEPQVRLNGAPVSPSAN